MNNGKVFVCSKDKVLLSDLLFSIYNGFLTQTKNRVIEANSNFYDEPTIWTEKLRFFESIGKAAKPRRQTQISDASSKHIDDIFVEIESRDASGTFLPVFVAVRLHSIPLTLDGAVTNAQIMGNLKSLHKEFLKSLKPSSTQLPTELNVMASAIQSENTLLQSPRTPGGG